MAQQSRLGLYGGPRPAYAALIAKAESTFTPNANRTIAVNARTSTIALDARTRTVAPKARTNTIVVEGK